jgi:hypothetical protein
VTVRLSVAIQAHPHRAYLAEPLAEQVGGTVVYDPDPDGYPCPWRTYRAALEATDDGCTHRLILQDDVSVCHGFRQAAELALRARPDEPVSFFHGGQPREHVRRIQLAHAGGASWLTLTSYRWAPALALAWPARLIRPALDWVEAQRWPVEFSADDEIIGRAFAHLGLPIHVTIPSLVQHHDLVPSIVRRHHVAGADPGRRALLYIGDGDPATISW